MPGPGSAIAKAAAPLIAVAVTRDAPLRPLVGPASFAIAEVALNPLTPEVDWNRAPTVTPEILQS